MDYRESGVDYELEKKSMDIFLKKIDKTHFFSLMNSRYAGVSIGENGYFANVIKITDSLGIVVSCDGVGSKILIAQMMNKYDTIGIDLVAMVVNDIICLGATPQFFVDYLAVQSPHKDLLSQLADGLVEGCRYAGVSICGGELAQIEEIVSGIKDGYGFDLAGFGIGTIDPNFIIDGSSISEGDVIIGLKSSGLHSNGYTLARKSLFKSGCYKIDNYISDFGSSIGEELLKPTKIYTLIMNYIGTVISSTKVKALINITGGGLQNLLRVRKDNISFIIDNPIKSQPIFDLIQFYGNISDEEMYKTFNMGIGFCIVIDKLESELIMNLIKQHGIESQIVGHVEKSGKKEVLLIDKNIIIG